MKLVSSKLPLKTKRMHILVVEDEQKIAAFIRRGLMENGFVVDVAEDGEQGLEYALARKMDLIILDVALPKRDGWSIMSELRNAGVQTPVLFLTARDGVPDRVKGFDLGADAIVVGREDSSHVLRIERLGA